MKAFFPKILFMAFFALFVAVEASAKTWKIETWTYRKYKDREKSFTYAADNSSDGDVLELQNDLTVYADVQVYKDITVCSSPGSTYTMRNVGSYYICNVHPGGKLTLTNIIVDCENKSRYEDLFNLNGMEITGSVTNVARMVLKDGAVIRNVYLSSYSSSENAAIHVKEGAVLRIEEGALIENCDNQSSPGKGGAICCDYGTIIMTGGTITGCRSKGAGGAIHSDGTRIDAVEVQGRSARGDIFISGGYITNNTCAAGMHGGAIYLGNSGPMILITGDPVISNNFSGVGTDAIADDISTYLLNDRYANRLKLTGHSDANPDGFTTNGISFTGWVGVRYPLENDNPQGVRFGGQWEYFNGTQEEPRQFFWNGDNDYRGRLEGNALIWSKHVTYELPKDDKKIAELIASGEESPLYVELDADYEMTVPVYVPENYQIILDLQGFELKCDFHVENTTGQVVIRDSSLMKSGKVTGYRESPSPTAFLLEGGSYHTQPPPEWIATNRVLIGNYCEVHPYMVASLAWEANATAKMSDLTNVALSEAGDEVRIVSTSDDIDDITFSTGDWVNMMHTNANFKVQVFAAAAVSNEVDGSVSEVGERLLLFDSDKGMNSSEFILRGDNSNDANDIAYGREDSFAWDAMSYGLIKLIHVTLREQGALYVTNKVESAYFRFPDASFQATQRKTLEKLPIALSDALLDSLFGFDRATGFSDVGVSTLLDGRQGNGLMKWENLVTGTDENQLLLGTASESADGLSLGISLVDADKTPCDGTGYGVWYDIRKSTPDGWKRVGEPVRTARFSVPLLDAEGGSAGATGFYRITTLIVPDDKLSVTNEIPSTNIVGVLEVAGVLTNTLAAVPWVSLAVDPRTADDAPVTISNYVHTAHLGDEDAVKVASNGHIYRKWHWDRQGRKWNGAVTVTPRSVTSAGEASEHSLGRDSAVWIERGDPLASPPIFLIGQYSASRVTLRIEGAQAKETTSTLVPNPSMEAVKINDYSWGTNPVKGDLIRIPTEKIAPVVLLWSGTQWGRYVPVPGSRGQAWVTDDVVPAGTGFWYTRSKGAPAFDIELPHTEPAAE